MITGEPLYMNYQVQEDYVPILGYHDIDDKWESSLIIKTENFRKQVKYMTETLSCNWITMEKLAGYVKNRTKLPTNSCIMNFDDGSTTQYHKGLSILNEYKVPSTFYIAIDNIDENEYYMTSKEIRNLDKMGHDMESHTLTHARLSSLTKEEQEGEILGSKVEMNKRGYHSETFAYPYGNFNLDTEDILLNSSFVLTRDIEQKNTWKDPRSPVISYNTKTYTESGSNAQHFNYMLHFWYIKPEVLSIEELHKKVAYTGWWQFEDNYLRVKGTQYSVKVTGSAQIIPTTDTSYAVLILNNKDDEIATQFMTKYEGGFTIDMIIANATEDIAVSVYVDDIEYEVYAHEENSEYSLKYGISSLTYYNFYINVDNLESGVHKINVKNKFDERIYLDKFRIFSNVNQDFFDPSPYKKCNPHEDDYCGGSYGNNWVYAFNMDRFLRNMINSAILLGFTLGVTCILISCMYMYFNCCNREKEDKDEEEDSMV
jgi:peptidoglycan/xylan/chitin deacetylase (PgdA/CDA1 family)